MDADVTAPYSYIAELTTVVCVREVVIACQYQELKV